MSRSRYYNTFRKFRTDKGERHQYDYMYNVLFTRIGDPANLLEIGIQRGFSLAAWKSLFPSCRVVGVDVTRRDDIVPQAIECELHFTDSTDPVIKETVGSGYDVIIDDGSHRVDDQWGTFLNLRGCWDKAYVIEDVEGIVAEKILRKRLAAHGYTRIETYNSLLQNIEMKKESPPYSVLIDFYSMVIYPK